MENTLKNTKHVFEQLIHPFNLKLENSELYFQKLITYYQEKGRYYHNTVHIENMCALLIEASEQNGTIGLTDFDAVGWAILFHDCIYQPFKTDNETQSALVARQFLIHLGASQALIEKVCAFIEATKTHQNLMNDPDLDLFLDLDLSILGSDSMSYQEYAQNIRKEYHLVPSFLYNSKRKAVLEHFLTQERIYKSVLGANYEKKARENLSLELKTLTP